MGGGGADFNDIQPAIDAARNGDLIFVRPGSYRNFVLAKGLTIRATGNDVFVSGVNQDVDTFVGNIGSGKRAVLSGLTFGGGTLYFTNSTGELIGEDLLVLRTVVSNCGNVSFTGLTNSDDSNYCPAVLPTVSISSSTVRVSLATIHGQRGSDSAPCGFVSAGGSCVEIADSRVVLARCNVRGGIGGEGSSALPGGSGGTAITSSRSTVIGMGLMANVIDGGAGGNGYGTPGGNGGLGIDESGGTVLLSQVTVRGGSGGTGSPPGQDGGDWQGNLQRDDRYPSFDLDGGINPGDMCRLVINATSPGRVVMMLSQFGGYRHDPAFVGPPLSVVPGGFFFSLPLGHANGTDEFVVSAPLPDDPSLEGFLLNVQALILGDDTLSYLTNGLDRVIGE
ncbi:MAG: hypothetical protein U1E76_18765 [Planctomycetota bacterium]